MLERGEVLTLNKEYLGYAMEIVDSATDASDLTKNERVTLLHHTYAMVSEFFEKKMSTEDLETKLQKLKKDTEIDVQMKQGFLKTMEKILTPK